MSLKHDSFKKRRKDRSKWKYDTWEEFEEKEIEELKEELRYKEPTITATVRISAGKIKNLKIDIPRKTRPLTDRMKVRIFDILREDIANKSVLDLYAGSGSFGLEALSRGAQEATFVDAAKNAYNVLMENVKKSRFLTETTIIREKAEDFLPKAIEEGAMFDIIFMDPPYKLYNRKTLFKINNIVKLAEKLLPGVAKPTSKRFKGVIILKHPTRYPIENLSLESTKLFESYQFGMNSVSMFIVANAAKKV